MTQTISVLKLVSAAYGKSANPATLLKNSNAAAAALAAAQWTNSSSTPTGSVGTGPPCTEVKTEVIQIENDLLAQLKEFIN